MAKTERFIKIYTQGALTTTEIWVDRLTGVNYIYHQSGYSGGLTPLLDQDGKVVITPMAEIEK
ncbi:MAG: xylan 1,4-beta-xylosidase [Clostridia bacterium]|nr:xylan 1,4-beta-xylosidase [Clostridia bacterium]